MITEDEHVVLFLSFFDFSTFHRFFFLSCRLLGFAAYILIDKIIQYNTKQHNIMHRNGPFAKTEAQTQTAKQLNVFFFCFFILQLCLCKIDSHRLYSIAYAFAGVECFLLSLSFFLLHANRSMNRNHKSKAHNLRHEQKANET